MARRRTVWLASIALWAAPVRDGRAQRPASGTLEARPVAATSPVGVPYCPGEYADDFSALVPRARELEQRVPAYTFCIRTAAVYECPFYGTDGSLKRRKRRVVAHGTAFAYRQQAGETLLVTNQHVADWPPVTDAEHAVEDVPTGCRRVSDSLQIVDSDSDSFDRDDVQLARVVSDPQLDITIVKARGLLPIVPWKFGHSGGLKERNVVDVRGFPLGVFKATNGGKVVSAYDHDSYREWEHDDFVIDALLSPGNSGSPVFAISCKTGEFELVGVYHAGYSRGSAMNVVVGIDQLRELLSTLKRTPRSRPDSSVVLDGEARRRLTVVSGPDPEPFFPFGTMTGAVRVRDDGALFFELLHRDFPLRVYPLLLVEDLPSKEPQDFGLLGRVWVGSRDGLKEWEHGRLDAEARATSARVLDGLRRSAVVAFSIRAAERESEASREGFERVARLEKLMQQTSASSAELVQAVIDLAERLAPSPGEPTIGLRSVLAGPRPGPTVAPASPTSPTGSGPSSRPGR